MPEKHADNVPSRDRIAYTRVKSSARLKFVTFIQRKRLGGGWDIACDSCRIRKLAECSISLHPLGIRRHSMLRFNRRFSILLLLAVAVSALTFSIKNSFADNPNVSDTFR